MVQLDGDIEGTTATGNAVINNNTKKNLIIDGVRVENIATRGKQALYNKGTVEIKGNVAQEDLSKKQVAADDCQQLHHHPIYCCTP